ALAVEGPHFRGSRLDTQADAVQSPLGQAAPAIATEPNPREVIQERVHALEADVRFVGWSDRKGLPEDVEIGFNLLRRLVQHVIAREEDESALLQSGAP